MTNFVYLFINHRINNILLLFFLGNLIFIQLQNIGQIKERKTGDNKSTLEL